MFLLGFGDERIEVPGHEDIADAARDIFLGYGQPERHQPDEDWSRAEVRAYDMLASFLFMKLGGRRSAADPLAARLFGFSLSAHQIWWAEVGQFNGHAGHMGASAEYFLAAMGAQLLRGQDGARLMRDPSQWPIYGMDTLNRLAYAFWEARGRQHGRNDQDTDLARWVLKLSARAHRVSTHPGPKAYLQALGSQLFADPQEAVAVFYA